MSIYKAYRDDYTYWASWRMEDFLPEVVRRINDYFNYLSDVGMLELWDGVYCANYMLDSVEGHVGSKIQFVGGNGEFVLGRVNILRNLIRHSHVVITSLQPDVTPVAANDEFSTKAQVDSCREVIGHLDRTLGVSAEFRKCLEGGSGLWGIDYMVGLWDEDNNTFKIREASPREVIRAVDNSRPQWYVYVERANRFDIIKKYNITEDQIDRITNVNINAYDSMATTGYYLDPTESKYNSNNDCIDVFHFFHERCAALPEGRYTIFINDNVSLTDNLTEKFPFNVMPIHEFRPFPIKHSWLGYSLAFDLLGPQKMQDIARSNILTALDHARTVVSVPIGTLSDKSDPHMTLLQYPASQGGAGINVHNLTNLPQEFFEIIREINQVSQQLSGVNETTMGGAEAKSGSHAALLASTASQFQNETIFAYTKLIEATWTSVIDQIKNFMNEPLMLQIVGRDKSVYVKAFKKDKISDIVGVVYAQGISPLLSTPSGRMSAAQDLMKMPGSEFTPRDYIKLLDTGNLDPALVDERAEDMVLSAETTKLSGYMDLTEEVVDITRFDGTSDQITVVKEVRALITDNHFRHLQHHTDQICSPQIRGNSDLVRMNMLHCAEHVWLATYGSRPLLLASGQQPMPDFSAPQQQVPPPSNQEVPVSRVPNIAENVKRQGSVNINLPRQPNEPPGTPEGLSLPSYGGID